MEGETSKRENISVLVVEDNPVNQLVVSQLLQKAGCHVLTVDNGRQAIEAVGCTLFDLIFMDCQMPEVDGFEAARLIRQKIPDATIIALTAHATQKGREKCLEAGMNDCLVKPIRKSDIQLMLQKWRQGGKAAG